MSFDRKTTTCLERGRRQPLLAAGCALGATHASAADITLSYQAIVHATEVHDIPVEGLSGRAIGIAAFRGLAIFEDGRIANHWYAGHFDFHEQSGPFAGEALWVFEDGSTAPRELCRGGRSRRKVAASPSPDDTAPSPAPGRTTAPRATEPSRAAGSTISATAAIPTTRGTLDLTVP